LNLSSIQKTYKRYSYFYDLSFGSIFDPGRQKAIEKMTFSPGDHLLEVGVGTGLSLPLYPSDVFISGIDVSPEMLKKAHKKKAKERLNNVVSLEIMDAENMTFSENSFDKVVAMYVATVVPNPLRLVDEMRRVCKPDGEIYIVNHFQHNHPFICGVEKIAYPLSKFLGFRTHLSLDSFIEDAKLDVLEQEEVNFGGYWTLLRVRNNKQITAAME
jgi:phosphatidylethanolamine/phosphatidyl-N-methylethanolamine N-methyltransferase